MTMASPSPSMTLVKPGWRPPYVARIATELSNSASERQDGAGVVLNEWHVLTCLHVLHIPSPKTFDKFDRTSISTPLPGFWDQDVTPKISVALFHDEIDPIKASWVAEDEHLDLAILKLDRPAMGLEPALSTSSEAYEKALFYGFLKTQTGYEISTSSRGIDGDWDMRGHRRVILHHSHGAQGGFSGGPVFTTDSTGQSRFLGISVLGGHGRACGAIVAAEAIGEFLTKCGIDFNFTTSRPAIASVFAGYRETIDPFAVKNGLMLPAFERRHFKNCGERPIFMSRRPVCAAVAATAVGKNARRSGDRLPAHFDQAEKVEEFLRAIRGETGVPLRLLTPEEWEQRPLFKEETGGGTVIVGRPVDLTDLELGGKSLPLPRNVAIWLQAPEGPRVFKRSPGGGIQVSAAGLPGSSADSPNHERRVVFLAFKAGDRA